MMRHDEPATMMHLIRPLLLLFVVLLLLVISEQALGDTVRIHDVAGSNGPEITLSQVAELDGEYAIRFADIVIGRFEDGQAQAQIETSAILHAIRSEGAKLGLLDLQGFARCTVHRTFTEPIRAEPVQDAARAAEPGMTNVEARSGAGPVTVDSPTTVRALIERAVVESLGLNRSALEITFSDRDRALLNSSAVAGRYEVEAVSVPTLGDMSFKVYAYHGTQRVGNTQLVKASVAQRVIAVIASERITRGTLINRRQVRLREVLIGDVQQAHLRETALVVGQVASTTIQAGELITGSTVQLPIAVRRRERVRVELRSPGIAITFNGVAHDEGSVGDTIEVENQQTKERFAATIVARGKVVAGEQTRENKGNQQ